MKGFVTKELYNTLKNKNIDKKILNLLTVIEENDMDELYKLYKTNSTNLKLVGNNCPSQTFIVNSISDICKMKKLSNFKNLSKELKKYITEDLIKQHSGYQIACNKHKIETKIPDFLKTIGEIVEFKDIKKKTRYGLVFSFGFNNKNQRTKKVNGEIVENPDFYKYDSNIYAYVVLLDSQGLKDKKYTSVTYGNYKVVNNKKYKEIISEMKLK